MSSLLFTYSQVSTTCYCYNQTEIVINSIRANAHVYKAYPKQFVQSHKFGFVLFCFVALFARESQIKSGIRKFFVVIKYSIIVMLKTFNFGSSSSLMLISLLILFVVVVVLVVLQWIIYMSSPVKQKKAFSCRY